jgi:catechol 2,3-dioxygenase-like lactoylglutathione lyase family enzyme
MKNFLKPILVAMALMPISLFAETPAEISTSLMGPILRSTNFERSTEFYTKGLGLSLARKLTLGTIQEMIFCYGQPQAGVPVIILYKDDAVEKAPPIEHGNGFDRIVLRTNNAEALLKRLTGSGYAAGEMHTNEKNHAKFFMVHDPDGYEFEITEVLTK